MLVVESRVAAVVAHQQADHGALEMQRPQGGDPPAPSTARGRRLAGGTVTGVVEVDWLAVDPGTCLGLRPRVGHAGVGARAAQGQQLAVCVGLEQPHCRPSGRGREGGQKAVQGGIVGRGYQGAVSRCRVRQRGVTEGRGEELQHP